jgi:hypothetical protein
VPVVRSSTESSPPYSFDTYESACQSFSQRSPSTRNLYRYARPVLIGSDTTN